MGANLGDYGWVRSTWSNALVSTYKRRNEFIELWNNGVACYRVSMDDGKTYKTVATGTHDDIIVNYGLTYGKSEEGERNAHRGNG